MSTTFGFILLAYPTLPNMFPLIRMSALKLVDSSISVFNHKGVSVWTCEDAKLVGLNFRKLPFDVCSNCLWKVEYLSACKKSWTSCCLQECSASLLRGIHESCREHSWVAFNSHPSEAFTWTALYKACLCRTDQLSKEERDLWRTRAGR